MKRILAIGIILLFIGMSISSSTGFNVEKQSTTPLNGKTLYVGGSGPNNYTKIQDAIDNASDGDTVFVYDDSSPYYENIIVNKSINLFGENRNTTVIDGRFIDSVVNISVNGVKVTGFMIINGGNNILNDAGIYVISSYNNISKNILRHNYEDAISISKSSNNTIMENIVKDNYDSGIVIGHNSYHNLVIKNIVEKNVYCGISVSGLENKVIQNTIRYNADGGIRINGRNNIISRNNISNNQEDGIYLSGGSNDNFIYGNDISNNDEFGISISGSKYNIISRNDILKNDAYGVLIYKSDRNIISGNNISNNEDGLQLNKACNNTIRENNIINNYYGLMGSQLYL